MDPPDPPFGLSVPAVPEALDSVHELLHRFWHQVEEMDAADRMRFDLAVAEVASNVVAHARGATRLVIALYDTSEGVAATIDDDGEAVPAAVLEPHPEPDDMAESGRGLSLARRCVDEFGYSRVDGMNHWRMVRHRSRASE